MSSASRGGDGPEDVGTPGPSDRAATYVLRFFAAAVFVLVVGVFFAYTAVSERGDSDQPVIDSDRGASELEAGAEVGPDRLIGPADGTDIGAYVEDRTAAVLTATGQRVAVVSLAEYSAGDTARDSVGSLPVEALLAAAPGDYPSIVTTTLDEWAEERRRADEVEREEIAKLLPTVDDPAFKSFYESELTRLDVAIESASADSAVVFALVVSGDAEELAALADTPGIRLVDVSEAPEAASDAVFRGLRPEETTRAGAPPTRPVD